MSERDTILWDHINDPKASADFLLLVLRSFLSGAYLDSSKLRALCENPNLPIHPLVHYKIIDANPRLLAYLAENPAVGLYDLEYPEVKLGERCARYVVLKNLERQRKP